MEISQRYILLYSTNQPDFSFFIKFLFCISITLGFLFGFVNYSWAVTYSQPDSPCTVILWDQVQSHPVHNNYTGDGQNFFNCSPFVDGDASTYFCTLSWLGLPSKYWKDILNTGPTSFDASTAGNWPIKNQKMIKSYNSPVVCYVSDDSNGWVCSGEIKGTTDSYAIHYTDTFIASMQTYLDTYGYATVQSLPADPYTQCPTTPPPPPCVDTDNDGVPDDYDPTPNDPTPFTWWIKNYQNNGYKTIAYSDGSVRSTGTFNADDRIYFPSYSNGMNKIYSMADYIASVADCQTPPNPDFFEPENGQTDITPNLGIGGGRYNDIIETDFIEGIASLGTETDNDALKKIITNTQRTTNNVFATGRLLGQVGEAIDGLTVAVIQQKTIGTSSTGFGSVDSANLSGVNSGVNGLGSKIDGLGTSINGLGTKIDAVGTGVNGLGTKLDGIGAGIEGLGTGIDGLGDDIEGIASGEYTPTAETTEYVPDFGDFARFGTRFDAFVTAVKATELFNLPTQFLDDIPTGGAPVLSMNMGSYGNFSFDFSLYDTMFEVLKALVLIGASFSAIQIIILKT